jgi:predicted NBD/HSP70 family sugar kinase
MQARIPARRTARSATRCGYLTLPVLGEGVGCGLIADGRLTHGVSGMAGEIGHLVAQPGGRTCQCGNKGCLVSLASTQAIPQVFDELAGRGSAEASDLGVVIAYIEKGDKRAAAALEKAGDALGIAISTVLDLINPEKLVLYGPAELVCESRFPAAERFMSCVRESSKEHAFSTAASDPRPQGLRL